jgi:hypothetical protein
MGQELIKLLNGVFSDLREHVLEPRERIDLHQCAGGHKTPQNRRRFPTTFTAYKELVFTANRYAAQTSLGAIVVDR